MLSDYEPIIWELPGRTIRVWAVADVHIGSKECDLEGFRAFLRRVMADPDSFIVIAGDLLDNAICAPASVFGSQPSEAMETAIKLLEPLASDNRILAVVSGNHEQPSSRLADVDILEVLCYRLGIQDRYRCNMGFVRVNLRNGGVSDSYALLVMHGASRGRVDKFHVEGVDAFIHGHVHDPEVRKPARIIFGTNNKVSVRSMVSVTASSWLNYGGYGASKLYAPRATSDPQCLILEYTNTNTRRGECRVMW